MKLTTKGVALARRIKGMRAPRKRHDYMGADMGLRYLLPAPVWRSSNPYHGPIRRAYERTDGSGPVRVLMRDGVRVQEVIPCVTR